MFFFSKEKIRSVRLRIHRGCINCGVCEKLCRDIFVLTGTSLNGKRQIKVTEEKLKELHHAEYSCPKAVIDIIE